MTAVTADFLKGTYSKITGVTLFPPAIIWDLFSNERDQTPLNKVAMAEEHVTVIVVLRRPVKCH